MPKTNEYTPARRVMMQITLWGVLAASLGVAALVDRSLASNTATANLGPVQHIKRVYFQFPADWPAAYESTDDPRIIAEAPDPAKPTRAIRIFSQTMRIDMPAANYFRDLGLAEEIFGNQFPRYTPATVGGNPAIFMHSQRLLGVNDNGESVTQSELAVCAVFPNHVAVTIWVSDSGTSVAADLQLLRQIAASIKVD